jgi:hypothetical protein
MSNLKKINKIEVTKILLENSETQRILEEYQDTFKEKYEVNFVSVYSEGQKKEIWINKEEKSDKSVENVEKQKSVNNIISELENEVYYIKYRILKQQIYISV